ncbi:MAG: hypothetical protein WC607_00565 [Candidatus Micrarchaeia archaeon]
MPAKPGESPATRGIPSKRSLWFDYGQLPMSLGARWEPEDFLKLVFPPQYQAVQYEIALKLLHFLSEREEADGDALATWMEKEGVANSTLRNLVIPKLVRTGMVARERRNPTGQDDRDKRHAMVLKASNRFGEAFKHVGSEWTSLVETWRVKRRKERG